MQKDTVILIITTTTLVGLVVVSVIGWHIYQKVAPTVTGLEGDYQGIGGLLNLLRGSTPTTATK